MRYKDMAQGLKTMNQKLIAKALLYPQPCNIGESQHMSYLN